MIALDTNAAIAILNNSGAIQSWIAQFASVSVPIPVVGELRFGALKSKKPEENLQRIESLLANCDVLDVTLATAEVYARIRLQLKQDGKPIPENDVWIAASSVQHGLPLATSDEHFDAVRELEVVRWS